MKKENEQAMMGSAVICLVVAIFVLMGSDNNSPPHVDLPAPASTAADTVWQRQRYESLRRDSIMQVRADSILLATSTARLRRLPDSTLRLVATRAHHRTDSARLTVVLNEVAARDKRQVVQDRTAAILEIIRAWDASCPRATRQRIGNLVAQHSDWENQILATVTCSRFQIGMTAGQLRASLGLPKDINRTVGSWGVHEQWVYNSSYIYLEDGVVTSYQTSR